MDIKSEILSLKYILKILINLSCVASTILELTINLNYFFFVPRSRQQITSAKLSKLLFIPSHNVTVEREIKNLKIIIMK